MAELSNLDIFPQNPDDYIQYEARRKGRPIGVVRGLPNSHNGLHYIYFWCDSEIFEGDELCSADSVFVVKKITTEDTHEGVLLPILRAYI